MTEIITKVEPISEEQLEIVSLHLDDLSLQMHRNRWIGQQKGYAVYFIAWVGELPVGHALLQWDVTGNLDEQFALELDMYTHISDLYVLANYRSKAVGYKILDTIENFVKQKGFTQVGLSVAIDNSRARALYDKQGYEDAGFGESIEYRNYTDKNGEEKTVEEICTYLIKEL